MDDQRDAGTRGSVSPPRLRDVRWSECALLLLILGSLAATLNLLIMIQRTAKPAVASSAKDPEAPNHATAAAGERPSESARTVVANAPTAVKPSAPAKPIAPPEDPTKAVVARLANSTDDELAAAQQADRRATALEAARQAADAESSRWKRRELLVKQQIATLAARADDLEESATALDAERDVLARESDALKAALAKAGRRSGFAVLPYKGPNGTWRRPIVIECTAGGVKLQPSGAKFSSMDMSPLINPRSNPLVRAIAHELLRTRASDTPDGAAAVPYLVFLVRPNGIRPYYEARTCLEPLGIAFGYELIEQNLAVDVPDLDNLATWDGSVPLDIAVEPAPRSQTGVALNSGPDRKGASKGSGGGGAWPDRSGSNGTGTRSRTGSDSGDTDGSGDTKGSSPEDFVWPSRARQGAAGDQGGYALRGSGTGLSRDARADGDRSSPGTADDSPSPVGRPGLGGTLGARSFASGGPFARQSGSGTLGAGRGQGTSSGTGSTPADEPNSAGDPGTGPMTESAIGAGSSDLGTGSSGLRGSSSGTGTGSSGFGTGSSGFGTGSGRQGTGSPRSGTGSAPGFLNPASPSSGRAPGSSGSPSPAGNGAGGAVLPDLEPAEDGAPARSPQKTNSGPAATAGDDNTLSLPALPGATAARAGQNGNVAGRTAADPIAGAGTRAEAAASSGPGASPDLEAPLSGTDTPSDAQGAAGTAPASGKFAASGSTTPGRSPTGLTPSTSGSALSSDAGLSPASQGTQPPAGTARSLPSSSSALDVISSSGDPSQSASGSPTSGGLTTSSSTTGSGSQPSFTIGSSSPSSSSSSSSSGMLGMPLDATSSPPSSASSSSSMFSPSSSSALDSSSSDDRIFPPAPRSTPPPGTIEVPFEIVVVCREHDVLLHPGGYRVSVQAMRKAGDKDTGLLAREIAAIVRKRAIVDPLIRPKPRLKFLIENNGGDTFWTARRQLLFSLPDWPMALQVAGTQDPRVFPKETW